MDVLEKTGEVARIRHHNREMLVPADFLWEDNGQSCCEDYTDYCLTVACGDRLHLIRSTPEGCYVKKDGVTGWYKGRYQNG